MIMANPPIAKVGSTVAKHLGAGGKYVVQNLNPLEVVREYVGFLKTASEQKTERERISAKRDVAVKLIESEKDIILGYFKARFAERKEALQGLFDILHHAVETKNEHAMDTALGGILGIVKDSPLKDFDSFRQARADNKILEI